LKIIEVFKSNNEEERKKKVTEILIKLENNKYNYEKPIRVAAKYNKNQYISDIGAYEVVNF